MQFEVHLSSRAKRFLRSSSKDLYSRIIDKLKKLEEEPFPHDAKRVVGQREKVYRVRIGDYRILYAVFLDKNVVLVVNIDKRPKAYRL